MLGTLCFFEEPFSGTHDEKVVEGIAEFPFKDLVVEEIEVSGKVKPFSPVLDIGDVGDNFLQGPVGLEVSAQDIGITGMLDTGVGGRQLAFSGITVDTEPFHGTPDGRVAQLPAKLPFQRITNLSVAHHRVVGMDIRNIGVHALLCSLIAIEGSASFQPFVIAASGDPLHGAQF